MQKLSHAGSGRYTIKWIFAEPELEEILKGLRIEAGREVTVIRNSPFGGLVLRSEAGSFAMNREAVSGISV